MKSILLKYYLLLGLPLVWGLASLSGQSANVPPVTFRETIRLEASGRIFVPGDRLWYHLALLEQDTYLPSRLSRVARIELTDPQGQPLVRKTLMLDSSRSQGFFDLPGDLKSGIYFIRAYTNWMRNFGNATFTVLPVKVINPQDPPVAAESFVGKPEKPATVAKNHIETQLADNSLIVHFKTDIKDTVIRLLVHRSGCWYWFDRQLPRDGELRFQVPVANLPKGMVGLSLLRPDNSLLSGCLSDIAPVAPVKVDLTGIAGPVRLRDSCRLTVAISGNTEASLPPGLEVRVAMEPVTLKDESLKPGTPGWPADRPIPAEPGAYRDWLEQHRYDDETVHRFFRPGTPEPVPFDTANLPSLQSPGILFLPETRTPLVSGQVIDRSTGKPVIGASVAISLLGGNGFEANDTNGDGVFFFTQGGKQGRLDYALSFLNPPDSTWTLKLTPEYDDSKWTPPDTLFVANPGGIEYATARLTNLKLEAVFAPPATSIASPAVRGQQEPFFHPADRSIETDRFIELANVRELIYEVVPDVQVRKDGNRLRISVYSNQTFARDFGTLVLLDGIPVINQQELLELPSTRIRSVEVRNRLYIHGNYLFSSIVSFRSVNADFAGLHVPPQTIFGTRDGKTEQREGIGQDSRMEDAIPRLNPLVLWHELPSDRTIRFRINDLYGTFRARISGYGPDGTWYSGQAEWIVTPPNL